MLARESARVCESARAADLVHESRSRPLVYTAEQAAGLLQVTRRTVYELLRTGELRSVKIGKLRRIPLRALEAFLERDNGEVPG